MEIFSISWTSDLSTNWQSERLGSTSQLVLTLPIRRVDTKRVRGGYKSQRALDQTIN